MIQEQALKMNALCVIQGTTATHLPKQPLLLSVIRARSVSVELPRQAIAWKRLQKTSESVLSTTTANKDLRYPLIAALATGATTSLASTPRMNARSAPLGTTAMPTTSAHSPLDSA